MPVIRGGGGGEPALMDEDTIKRALTSAIKDGIIKDLIQSQVREAMLEVRQTVTEAVREALAQKDAEIKELKAELKETREQLNDLEQYSRRLCLNVSGIPEGGANEATDRLIIDTAKLAGVNLAPHDIDTSHRLGAARPGKPRTIIVRFASYKARQDVYNARRELRKPRLVQDSSVSAETAGKIFVSDNLTRTNQFVLYKARQLKKDGRITAAWSDMGRLKIRTAENGPTRIIRSLDDLEKFSGVPCGPATDAPPVAADGGSGRPVTRRQTRAAAAQ